MGQEAPSVVDLQAYINVLQAAANHQLKMYESKMLPKAFFEEHCNNKLELATKMKVKQDIVNARRATALQLAVIKCGLFRAKAEHFLQGQIEPDLARALWIIVQTYDALRLQPPELRQLLERVRSRLPADQKLEILFNPSVSDDQVAAYVAKKLPPAPVTQIEGPPVQMDFMIVDNIEAEKDGIYIGTF